MWWMPGARSLGGRGSTENRAARSSAQDGRMRRLSEAATAVCLAPDVGGLGHVQLGQQTIGSVERTTLTPRAAKPATAAFAWSVKSTAPATVTGEVQSSRR